MKSVLMSNLNKVCALSREFNYLYSEGAIIGVLEGRVQVTPEVFFESFDSGIDFRDDGSDHLRYRYSKLVSGGDIEILCVSDTLYPIVEGRYISEQVTEDE